MDFSLIAVISAMKRAIAAMAPAEVDDRGEYGLSKTDPTLPWDSYY